jgi:hypothetical protein
MPYTEAEVQEMVKYFADPKKGNATEIDFNTFQEIMRRELKF